MTTEQTQQGTDLTHAVLSAHALESLVNYQSADLPLVEVEAGLPRESTPDYYGYHEDGRFWLDYVGIDSDDSSPISSRKIYIDQAALTQWVARIPGLYWSSASERFRNMAPENIESRTDKWVTYTPLGKSQKVTGGIGTIKLTPSESGYRLANLTTTLNASAGVPVLISPDVWDHHNLKEGIVISGEASVREMPSNWLREFPAIKGVPRICAVIDNPDTLQVTDTRASILIHPFTVMEYWAENAQLLDFVYATADSVDSGYRGELETFFEKYRKLNDRDGSYLLAADTARPMWESEFATPAEMRKQKNQVLKQIEKRVQDNLKGESVIAPLLAQLNSASDIALLKKISDLAGLRHQQWCKNGSQADESSNLVGAAMEYNKIAELVQATHQVLN